MYVILYEVKESSYNGKLFIRNINHVIVFYFYKHPTSVLIIYIARIHKAQYILIKPIAGNIKYKFNVFYFWVKSYRRIF